MISKKYNEGDIVSYMQDEYPEDTSHMVTGMVVPYHIAKVYDDYLENNKGVHVYLCSEQNWGAYGKYIMERWHGEYLKKQDPDGLYLYLGFVDESSIITIGME